MADQQRTPIEISRTRALWNWRSFQKNGKYYIWFWADKGFNYASHDGMQYKEVYNWVLANPVLYDKPILNVKGKLSFWETDYHHCEDCNSVNHISSMSLIDDCWTCKKCCDELVDEAF